MRAWRVESLGEPSTALTLVDAPDPVPGEDEVAIQVETAALNFADVLLCRGRYQERPPLPFTPGLEVCGRVVGGPRDGERVVAGTRPPRGALAERVVVPSEAALPVPDDMPAAEATATVITYRTGYTGLHRRAGLRKGETLLVHAGAGGAGSAAIQLGRAAEARVIATAGGPEKAEVCRRLGADVVVDYTAEDFVPVVKEATDGRGADVIYDPVGGEVFDRSRRCVAFEGRLLVVGFAGGRIPEVAAGHVLVKNYSVVGVHYGLYPTQDPAYVRHAHEEIVRLWRAGQVAPLIGGTVPLAEVPQALERLAGRGSTGKLVVDVRRDAV